MRILVTGGSGMIGQTLQSLVKTSSDHEWLFPSSKEMNLMDIDHIEAYIKNHKPNFVIHLAANVGGLFKNLSLRVEMLHDNLMMNENILKACYENQIHQGIFFCSTCIFPMNPPKYPMTEDMMLLGEPHSSNASYAWSKRLLYFQCQNYNEEHNCHYLCLIPTNIFGPFDNFSIRNGHVIGALIHRFFLAQKKNMPLEIQTGHDSQRQFITARDVSRILLECLEKWEMIHVPSMIIANTERRIVEVIEKIADRFDYQNYKIIDKELGQDRKPCSTTLFNCIFPEFIFEDFDKALENTIHWFQQHYHTDARL